MGDTVRPLGRPRPPEVPSFAVSRPRLEVRLSQVRPGGLGLIVAAAGSGKSVLLAQWARRAPEAHCVLLRLTAADADGVVCARNLVDAIRVAVPDLPAPSPATDGSALGAPFVEALLGSLEVVGADLLLVLDDLHAIENPEVIADLGRIVTGLPRNVRAAVGSRWDLGFPLREARLDGRLVEVRRAELAFDVAEGRALVGAVSGHDISEADSAELVSRTDGWAVGLQLAAVSMQGQPGPRPVLDADERLITEYLAEEVLDQQEPELRRFLLQTSVLEWLSPEVCDALTETGDAKEMLSAALDRSLFLVPLDRRGERFRYHHLFADLLRLQLGSEDPEAPARLHRRAATWFLDRGYVAEAVEHLLAGGDHHGAFDVISQRGHLVFEQGQVATLVRWLSAISEVDRHASALVDVNLLAAQAGADLGTGAAETYRRLRARSDLRPEERATAEAFYATLVQGDLPPAEAERASATALRLLPSLDPGAMPAVLGFEVLSTVEGMARYGAAQAHLQNGRLGAAADGFGALVALPAMKYPIWRVVALAWWSASLAWAGRLTEAERHATAAIAAARDIGADQHVSTASAHLAMASVALDRSELDIALGHLREGEARIRGSRRSVLHALLRLVEARVVAAREGSEVGIDRLRRPVGVPLGSGLFVTTSDAMEAGLLVSLGRLREAETVLVRVGQGPAGLPARIALLLACDDVAGARRLLDAWTPDADDLRAVVQRGIRTAAVLDSEGDPRGAVDALVGALARAEPEGLRQPFRTMPNVLRALRALPRSGSRSFVASILAVPVSPAAVRAAAGSMVEPLTEREQGVLVHLPTRHSNTEIAADLYISVNTMKTHLRNIYRKLGVSDRDAAVARATDLGLL